tara:strand:+ start:3378 stop:3941 length:564 start_codon:yes stop_codon:yes gene_type:complete
MPRKRRKMKGGELSKHQIYHNLDTSVSHTDLKNFNHRNTSRDNENATNIVNQTVIPDQQLEKKMKGGYKPSTGEEGKMEMDVMALGSMATTGINAAFATAQMQAHGQNDSRIALEQNSTGEVRSAQSNYGNSAGQTLGGGYKKLRRNRKKSNRKKYKRRKSRKRRTKKKSRRKYKLRKWRRKTRKRK